MSPLTILTNALQAIPAKARMGLLVTYSLVVVATGISRLAGFDGLDYLEDVLLYVGGYLGVQSAANVTPTAAEPITIGDAVAGDVVKPKHRE